MEKFDNVVDLGYDQSQVKEPFTMAFCYPKAGPVLVKGARNSVQEYIHTQLAGIFHYRLAHWRKGAKRGSWFIKKPGEMHLSLKEVQSGREKVYELQFKQFGAIITVAEFEKIPHEYIPDFDLFQVGM